MRLLAHIPSCTPRFPALGWPTRSEEYCSRPHQIHRPYENFVTSTGRSSPRFRDQFNNVLCAKDYRRCVPNLQNDDLVRLVGYLHQARRHVALPPPRSSQWRLLMVSTLLALHPKSQYVNSEGYTQWAKGSRQTCAPGSHRRRRDSVMIGRGFPSQSWSLFWSTRAIMSSPISFSMLQDTLSPCVFRR